MSTIRRLGRTLALSLVSCALALPAAADGLSRFKEAMKQAPAGALTYKSAKALGDNGFVLDGVVLTPPPETAPGAKPEPVKIKRIAVEDFDFAALDNKAPPKFIKIDVEGIVIAARPAGGVDLGELAGVDKITADFQLDYRFDPEKKTMTLNRLDLDLNGLARIEVSMILDGVSGDTVDNPEAAMKDATLRSASLVVDDRSLIGKLLPATAKLQGIPVDAAIQMVKAVLDARRAGQGPATLAVLDALGSYVDDYKHPNGPLRVTLNPPGKVSAAELAGMTKPDEAVTALGLSVSYAGTRSQASAAPAAAIPAQAEAKPGCTPGARFFVRQDEAWWAVTVREASPSGDKCVAVIDGGGADDEVTFALDETRAWSIDGPGEPIAKCNGGDKVLVESDGGWYPARVLNTPVAEGQCLIKYESDEDEETVPLKRVRRLK
jgi:hypothetical protein